MVSPAQTDNKDQAIFSATLAGILKKLNLLLDQEARYLEKGEHEDLQEFARKKISLFSQLRVLNQRYAGLQLSDSNAADLKDLKQNLLNNLKMLDTRMKAIGELNKTIEAAVLNDRSDGTYSVDGMAMRGYG
ncbi:MAG: hypothetical protein AAF412_14670 [Pseudomonadota bacterium]